MIFVVFVLQFSCMKPASSIQHRAVVLPGIDVLENRKFDILQGRRVGLITNPTGVSQDLRSTIDILHEAPEVDLVALFGPEHGVRGNVMAGEHVANYTDKKTGLPVYSLYGKTRKPTPEMLQGIDELVYDIQDIGSRSYTYIYTMALAMQAAGAQGIPFVVLDRPNPLGADLIEGPVLEKAFSSFIGLYPIPYIYGMTAGELARYFNREFGIGADLTVVPMQGYHRDMRFADTGLQWVATSPHIPHAETALFYPATGIIGELQAVSEGVGSTIPFEFIGQTWIDPDVFAAELNKRHLPGVHFRPCYVRPYYFTFANRELGGVQIHILDAKTFSPLRVQMHLIDAILKLYPGQKIFDTPRVTSFDRAMGTDRVRKALLRGEAPDAIIASWEAELKAFEQRLQRYLLYKE